ENRRLVVTVVPGAAGVIPDAAPGPRDVLVDGVSVPGADSASGGFVHRARIARPFVVDMQAADGRRAAIEVAVSGEAAVAAAPEARTVEIRGDVGAGAIAVGARSI